MYRTGFDRRTWTAPVLLVLAVSALLVDTVGAARFATKNFVVTAPTEEQAKVIAEAAEHYRRELSLEWTGRVMPNWSKPCPIKTTIGNMGAGGATTFSFDRGEVFGWKMTVQGSMERILDSVIPHEVNHTVFACYFRRPLPRWADEGAATLTEHESEKARQTRILNQVIRTTKRIPLQQLLSMKEYPTEMRDVLTLYAEGYALADLLVQKGGKAKYLKFLQDAHEQGWDDALKRHYDYTSVDDLERRWSDWVIAGSPSLLPDGELLASTDSATTARGQSPPAKTSMTGMEVSRLDNDLVVGTSETLGSIDELLEFGANDAAASGRVDRSRLTHPVHQVPIGATHAEASFAAFKMPWLSAARRSGNQNWPLGGIAPHVDPLR